MRLLVAAPLFVAALAARPADACGGLFCASSNSVPVDQTAERILFEVNDDASVTATVEVSYTGDPASFSWIVPVPETPTLVEVASPSLLLLLDTATRPQILPPPMTCSASFGGANDGGAVASPTDPDTVEVEELPNVGPYGDIVVVSSDDADALATWLDDNGYLITDAMRPYIADYVAEGQKFLALRLQPSADVDDIVPVRFTCPAAGPHIPLRLTAIAAKPELSIVAFIAGAGRYQPLNYRGIVVDEADVHYDRRYARYNYFPLVSFLVDQEGGQAFVTERAQASSIVQGRVDSVFLGTSDEEAARADLTALLARRPYFTRLYTRMNPEEMVEDPVFALSLDAPDVSGVLDLSGQPEVDLCAETPAPLCGSSYCGQGASCASTALGEGCACAEGQTAHRLVGPFGPTTYCASPEVNVLGDVFTGASDPCAFFACGDDATCVGVNGAATCRCGAGTAAIVDFQVQDGVACVAVLEEFAPGVIIDGEANVGGGDDDDDEPGPLPPGETGLPPNYRANRGGALCACVAAAPSSSGVAVLAGALVVGACARRRRRAGQR